MENAVLYRWYKYMLVAAVCMCMCMCAKIYTKLSKIIRETVKQKLQDVLVKSIPPLNGVSLLWRTKNFNTNCFDSVKCNLKFSVHLVYHADAIYPIGETQASWFLINSCDDVDVFHIALEKMLFLILLTHPTSTADQHRVLSSHLTLFGLYLFWHL